MPNVPRVKAGWTNVAFGDVVRQVKDKVDPKKCGLDRYIAGEHMDTDDLCLRRWGEIGDDYLGPAFHMRFKPGHVLYGSRRTYLRKVALADFEGVTANTTYVVETKAKDVLLPELLPFLMQAEPFHDHSKRESKGSVNPYVNFSDLAWYEFALPPLDEQRRFARALQCLDQVAEKLKVTMTTLANLEQSLFERSLELDEGVEHGTFESFCEFITDGDHNPPRRIASGIPYLVVASIGNGEVDDSNCTFISPEDYERVSKRYAPKGGDVLLSCVGSVGDVAIVPEGFTFAADRSLAVYRTNADRLIPEYAAIILRSRKSQRYFASVATGTAQMHLYLNDLRRQKITVPTIAAQLVLIERTVDIERGVRSIATRFTDLRAIRASIMIELTGGAN